MINIETEDSNGNKLKVEVTEFRTLADAAKVITELKREIAKLQIEIEKLKNGTNNSK